MSPAPESWRGKMAALLERIAGMGITADLLALSLLALWGICRFLQGLAERGP